MTANVVTALSGVQQMLAEKASWGGPEWTVVGLGISE